MFGDPQLERFEQVSIVVRLLEDSILGLASLTILHELHSS
jgi:hypothetical protein